MTSKFPELDKELLLLVKNLKKNTHGLDELDITLFSLNDFISRVNLDTALLEKQFTTEEISYCKNNLARYAGRLAVKTSIYKILRKNIPWLDMQILPSSSQQPILTFLNKSSGFNQNKLSISITHEDDLVAAIAANSTSDRIISVGIDAAKIARFTAIIKNHPNILQKIFTSKELQEIKDSSILAAEKWVGKESVSKALGIGIWHGAQLKEIEILKQNNLHKIILKNKLKSAAHQLGINSMRLNLINNDKYVLSVVLAVN